MAEDLMNWDKAGGAGDPGDEAAAVASSEEEAAAIAEAMGEVESGGLDDALDVGAVKRRVRQTLARRAPRMSPLKQAYVTAKVTNAWASRQFNNANRLVPFHFEGAVAANAIVTFQYEPPDPGRLLGLVASTLVTSQFGLSDFIIGTFRIVEPAGVTPPVGAGVQSASLAQFAPDMVRYGVAFGSKLMSMIARNTKLVLSFKNVSGGPVTGFTVHAQIFCPGVGLAQS